jgi:hypothetical protein
MVAAWMSAETGVGPSIASGSQTWSGTCADLPTAPQKMQSTAAERVAVEMTDGTAISVKASVPVMPHSMRMPIMNPKSPTRLQRKAFLAASAAEVF